MERDSDGGRIGIVCPSYFSIYSFRAAISAPISNRLVDHVIPFISRVDLWNTHHRYFPCLVTRVRPGSGLLFLTFLLNADGAS